MLEERVLIEAFARAANDYRREAVVGASANMLLNAIRQSHKKHIDAEEHLEALFAEMEQLLRRHHYHEDGTRNDRTIVLPSPLILPAA